MKLEGEQKLVRIFVGEADRWKGAPLYEAIVDEARALGLAGATVFKGVMGYGCKAHVHTAKLLELSYDQPVAVEIVDSEAKIAKLLPKLQEMVTEGLVTIEKVHVILYRADGAKPRSRKAAGK
jgi:PII-like signaling protein